MKFFDFATVQMHVTKHIIETNNVIAMSLIKKRKTEDAPKKTTRAKRRKFKHQRAALSLQDDYLGPEPLFKDKDFETHFRISRARFQRLLEDTGNSKRLKI
jgi:uncharacterized protein YigA (DUF484 family)